MGIWQVVALQAPRVPDGPIMVKLSPPESELASLRDVLLTSLGLTGSLLLVAVVLAACFGGLMFWIRSRRLE